MWPLRPQKWLIQWFFAISSTILPFVAIQNALSFVLMNEFWIRSIIKINQYKNKPNLLSKMLSLSKKRRFSYKNATNLNFMVLIISLTHSNASFLYQYRFHYTRREILWKVTEHSNANRCQNIRKFRNLVEFSKEGPLAWKIDNFLSNIWRNNNSKCFRTSIFRQKIDLRAN